MELFIAAPGSVLSADVLQLIGLAGFLVYIGSFAGLQIGLLDGNGITYTLLSITAATLVLISLAGAFNLASLLIQVSWILIGFIGICRHLRKRPQPISIKTEFSTRRGHS